MDTSTSQVSVGTLYLLWGISLLLGVVVLLVVAYLLRQIEERAQRIHTVVGQIWMAGQQIANATIHIPQLATINRTVAGIHAMAQKVLEATADIRSHAESCPGCPQCVLKS